MTSLEIPKTFDRAKFYSFLRRRSSGLFGTKLTQGQVDGLENLLDVWDAYYSENPVRNLAYDLATAYWETGRSMQPVMERGRRSYFNKYEPGTRIGRMLGNTVKGDGFRFRGAGHVQNTGRRNAKHATDQLNKTFGLNVDLVANPEMRLDPFISAHSLFLGNKEGWWTGKGLEDFIDDVDEDEAEELREFINSRRVVNGTDKAKKIAHFAVGFEMSLKHAGYRQRKAGEPPRVSVDVPPVVPANPYANPIADFFAGIARFIASFLRRR